MAVVTFVSHDGEKHEASIDEGYSLMQVAKNNAIRASMVTAAERPPAAPAT
ncbi:hypothetical protein [Nocardioides sp. T2.26MG-1]|uniref:hypothetical protein n=1 Tax=Nocardioides sp. T2.26MG-1 TaxID=3041166 RepID=UPI00247737F9|nr:hypothetical protein [Nocardioides sp. T2.26MG-1]CAI9406767.1 hypothetical protein HIDPHFAB_04648 [Nocardioides sp. T2.26MG-1]